jgi:hypothetical protein
MGFIFSLPTLRLTSFNDSFKVQGISCITESRRVEDISWRFLQEHMEGSLRGSNFFIFGDRYAVFMVVAIKEEAKVGSRGASPNLQEGMEGGGTEAP